MVFVGERANEKSPRLPLSKVVRSTKARDVMDGTPFLILRERCFGIDVF